MPKFPRGSQVYVPTSLLPGSVSSNFALTRTTVREQKAPPARSVRIDVQDEDGNDIWVASTRLHDRNLGITVLRIGDLMTEDQTLDPLAKSMLHYLRLLLEPNGVRLREVRTVVELEQVWHQFGAVTSHVVLVGHGTEHGIALLDRPQPVRGDELADILETVGGVKNPKTFVSLSCLTGRAAFAKPFSESAICRDYLAPFHSVHSAAASLYAQSLFSNHLLDGRRLVTAHRRARAIVGSSGVSFRHWRNGNLQNSGANVNDLG